MKEVIEYKGFIGSVQFNSIDEIYFGKIEGIEDLISFEGKSVTQLEKAFKESVNDYILLCKKYDIKSKAVSQNKETISSKLADDL